MRRCATFLAVCVFVVLIPVIAFAQGAVITGVVKDGSGAVLPGVTVEAASPALIEKTRSAVTDGTGQYRIVDLRAGTYSVTVTLQGFSTIRREGIGNQEGIIQVACSNEYGDGFCYHATITLGDLHLVGGGGSRTGRKPTSTSRKASGG